MKGSFRYNFRKRRTTEVVSVELTDDYLVVLDTEGSSISIALCDVIGCSLREGKKKCNDFK